MSKNGRILKKRGRPRIKVSLSAAKKVAILTSLGWSGFATAAALGLSRSALLAKYPDAIQQGAVQARADAAWQLYQLGMRGSVAALRLYLSLSGGSEGVREPPSSLAVPELQAGRPRGWDAVRERKDQEARAATDGKSQLEREWDALLPKYGNPQGNCS